jgi:hypothetical protein
VGHTGETSGIGSARECRITHDKARVIICSDLGRRPKNRRSPEALDLPQSSHCEDPSTGADAIGSSYAEKINVASPEWQAAAAAGRDEPVSE